MRPTRRGAPGCPDTTSPGGGALQAVVARSFSQHRAEVLPEARTPGYIGIPGPNPRRRSDPPSWEIHETASSTHSGRNSSGNSGRSEERGNE